MSLHARPHPVLGPARGVGHPGSLVDPLVMERVIRQLPDMPAVQTVIGAMGYRGPAYMLGKHLAQLRKRWEDFNRAQAAKAAT